MDQTKLKVRLTKEGVACLDAARAYWESYAGWNKCLHDENMKAAFIAGFLAGWSRDPVPPLAHNVVPAEF